MRASSTQHIALALFSLTIFIAMLFAAKLPVDGSEWSDMTSYFILAVVACGVSLVWWRRLVKAHMIAVANGKAEAEGESPLKEIVEDAVTWTNSVKVDSANLREVVDEILGKFIMPLNERRSEILSVYGLEVGADILITLAYSERQFNRVWSAWADGVEEEARACWVDASSSLDEVKAKILQAA